MKGKTMYAVVAVVLGLLAISFHELGHYEAMRRCGIRIREVSLLGFPLPWIPSIRWRQCMTIWGIHPFLIGAYVRPHPHDKVEDKSFVDQLYIYNNGITANLVYALLLYVVWLSIHLVEELLFEFGVYDIFRMSVGIGLSIAVVCLSWLTRRYVAFVLMPIALVMLVLVGHTLFTSTPTEAVEAGSGGPIAVFMNLINPDSFSHAILLAGIFSLNLGAVNLLPLFPLDGGRMLYAVSCKLFGEKIQQAYLWIAIPMVLGLVGYLLFLDVLRIVSWF